VTRTIRDNRDEENDLDTRRAVVDTARGALGQRKVIAPYYPRPAGLPAGDPASASGVEVAESELDADLREKISAVGQTLEVTLTFPSTVPPGTAFDILSGVYAGGGPAAVVGDAPPAPPPHIGLPSTGVEYLDDGRIEIMLNGQELQRGAGLGFGEAQWVSTTQMALSRTIYPGNEITVRAPVVPPAPHAV